jgi:hypothetical protein
VPDRTTKKTAGPSIVACESVATQLPSSVDFVGPQHVRHNIMKATKFLENVKIFMCFGKTIANKHYVYKEVKGRI